MPMTPRYSCLQHSGLDPQTLPWINNTDWVIGDALSTLSMWQTISQSTNQLICIISANKCEKSTEGPRRLACLWWEYWQWFRAVGSPWADSAVGSQSRRTVSSRWTHCRYCTRWCWRCTARRLHSSPGHSRSPRTPTGTVRVPPRALELTQLMMMMLKGKVQVAMHRLLLDCPEHTTLIHKFLVSDPRNMHIIVRACSAQLCPVVQFAVSSSTIWRTCGPTLT